MVLPGGPSSPYDVGTGKTYSTLGDAITAILGDTGGDLSTALGSDILLRVYAGGVDNVYTDQLDLSSFYNGQPPGNGDRIRIISMVPHDGTIGSGITIWQNSGGDYSFKLYEYTSLEGFVLTQEYDDRADGWRGVQIDKGYVFGCLFHSVSAVSAAVQGVYFLTGGIGEVYNNIFRDFGQLDSTQAVAIDFSQADLVTADAVKIYNNTIVNFKCANNSAGINGASSASNNVVIDSNYIGGFTAYGGATTFPCMHNTEGSVRALNVTDDSTGDITSVDTADAFVSYTEESTTDDLSPAFGSALHGTGSNNVDDDIFGNTRIANDIGAVESGYKVYITPDLEQDETDMVGLSATNVLQTTVTPVGMRTTNSGSYYLSKDNFIVDFAGGKVLVPAASLSRLRPGMRYAMRVEGYTVTGHVIRKMLLGTQTPIFFKSRGKK